MSAAVALDAPAGCAHCGLGTPAGQRFCCAGCEVVYGALAEHGLEAYYRVAGDALLPARTTAKTYDELDDAGFQRLHVRGRADGLAETALYLEEVRCTACVWLTERLPALLDGVIELRLDFGRGRADVTFDPRRVRLSQIARLLDRLGHPVHPYRGADREALRRREDRGLLIKIGVAGATAGNVMLLAIALYAGLFGGMGARDTTFFRWASMLVAVPALAFAASPFFRGAIGAVRSGRLHLDLPLALGVAVGLSWGALNTVRGVGEIYFDSLAMLVFLLLVARWVQSRQHRRAASAAEILNALTPRVARRVGADGVARDVPLEAVLAGEHVHTRAGDTVPVDGVIVEGVSTLDAGLLTGESRPVEVRPGDVVHAGTVNLGAPLTIRATATGEDTRVGRLIARIDDEARRRAPIQRFVDGLTGRFVTVVLVVAAVTAVAWSLSPAGPGAGLEHAMALLIVTCPCALALATPLAMTIAFGRAARRGLLIKGGDALERLATPGLMLLDKTGTLTEGRLRLVEWRGDVAARSLAAALERASAHPLARALVEGIDDGGDLAVTGVAEELGRGISGQVGGRAVAVGASSWIAGRALVSATMRRAVDVVAAAGNTPVLVAVDGRAVAVAGFADAIRADAAASIARLRAAGWRIGVLSGDDPRIVARVAEALDLGGDEVRGGVSPEGKVEMVRAARAAGPVVMVGDGVNDAAALAAATCGVAVHGSAEASIDAADVFVRWPGLAPLAELVEGAAATLQVIRRNLKVSLTYNLIGGTLAVTGLIHPLVAAILMPLSSLSVLLSSTRSRGFRRPETP